MRWRDSTEAGAPIDDEPRIGKWPCGQYHQGRNFSGRDVSPARPYGSGGMDWLEKFLVDAENVFRTRHKDEDATMDKQKIKKLNRR